MTTTFGSARSVFERASEKHEKNPPPPPAFRRRTSTPFLSSPSVAPRAKTTTSVVKSPPRRTGSSNGPNGLQKVSPSATTRRASTSSTSSPSWAFKKQQQTATTETGSTTTKTITPTKASTPKATSLKQSKKVRSPNGLKQIPILTSTDEQPSSPRTTNILLKGKSAELKQRKQKYDPHQFTTEEKAQKSKREEAKDEHGKQQSDLKQPLNLEDKPGKNYNEQNVSEQNSNKLMSLPGDKTSQQVSTLENTQAKHRKFHSNDKNDLAAIKLQSLFRGVRQRIFFAWMLQQHRKEKELRQRLLEIKAETAKELKSLEESVETYKKELRSKLDQRRAKYKDKAQVYERNKDEVEKLKQQNSQFRTKNENLKENSRKLRIKNLKLEKSNASQEEYTAQVRSHHAQCKEDNERLMEVQNNYRKKLDQLESSLDTRTAYAVSENRLKRRFRDAIQEYIKMVERSKDKKNTALLSSLYLMVKQAKKHDKTPDEPCPYEEAVGAGGQLGFDDSCSSWLHAPPSIGQPTGHGQSPTTERSPKPISSILSAVASLPGTGSDDDDSYVFEDSSIKSGSTTHSSQRKTAGDKENTIDHNTSNGRDLLSTQGRRGARGARNKNVGHVPVMKTFSDHDESDESDSRSEDENIRFKPKTSQQKQSIPNEEKRELKSGKRKPKKLPPLKPSAKKPTKHDTSKFSSGKKSKKSNKEKTAELVNKCDDGECDDSSSSEGSDSTSSSDENGSDSDHSQKEFDRSYQASIAKAASKLEGGQVRKKTTKVVAPPEPDDDESDGWSSGDSNSDSDTEVK